VVHYKLAGEEMRWLSRPTQFDEFIDLVTAASASGGTIGESRFAGAQKLRQPLFLIADIPCKQVGHE
jgi:hypothetical protein